MYIIFHTCHIILYSGRQSNYNVLNSFLSLCVRCYEFFYNECVLNLCCAAFLYKWNKKECLTENTYRCTRANQENKKKSKQSNMTIFSQWHWFLILMLMNKVFLLQVWTLRTEILLFNNINVAQNVWCIITLFKYNYTTYMVVLNCLISKYV